MTYQFGHSFRILHNCTGQAINNAVTDLELTAAQGHIMGFITHRANPPCAKDIEEAFQLSHATVSGLLSRLEKKGFIEFRPDENDRRCKRIYLLEKGRKLDEAVNNSIVATENRLVQGFTEDEKALFAQFLTRAMANMGEHNCKRRCKEETVSND